MHPHSKAVNTYQHKCRVWKYHLKRPVGDPLRSDFGPLSGEEVIDRILEAPSELDAIKISGIDPKVLL